jgi:hypothetical protein
LNFSAMPRHQNGELPGFRHQHLVAGLQRIDEGASQAPVPDARVDDDRLLGPKHPLHGRTAAWPISANSGPRWSMVGMSMARSTRSGTLVGPGNLQKMPSTVHGQWRLPGSCLGFASRSNITIWRACPRPATAVNA